ncbi:MAG: M48 family metallopeptidase [Candidatus Caenarcaniphilales bacterium]|nr:M48 family metallopeptidase [Candidatus Caenarcaniphilales bacterium]
MQFIPKVPDESLNVTKYSPLRDLFFFLSVLLGTLIAIYLILGLAVDEIVNRISPTDEFKIFKSYQNFSLDKVDASRSAELQKLLDRLKQSDPELKDLPLKIEVERGETPNAFALPGGKIIVLGGLLKDMDSENELAFVLGHEIGHFKNRDHLRSLGRGLVFAIVAGLFSGDRYSALAAGSTAEIAQTKYSQGQELAADHYGLMLLEKTYGHIGGAADFFDKQVKSDHHGKVEYFFASHPHPKERIIALKNLIEHEHFKKLKLKPLSSVLIDNDPKVLVHSEPKQK